MLVYVIRRLIQGVVVLLAVSFICFVTFRYMGDPVLSLAGEYATFQEQEIVRKAFGLDRPFYIQYLRFLFRITHGEFGLSYVSRMPALWLILDRFPASFELAISATSIAFFAGVGLGVLVSLRPHAIASRIIMGLSLAGISIPVFLIGILFIMIFAVYLGILPPFGRGETVQIGFWDTGFLALDGIRHLILPAVTLGVYQLTVLLRLTRATMREVLMEDYVKTAWSKGLPPRKVIFKHALRNALIPVVTIAGLQLGEQIAFSIVTEFIFQWPGMGNLLLSSIYEADHPVIVTFIMLVSVLILVINIIVDIIYVALNPRIRYG